MKEEREEEAFGHNPFGHLDGFKFVRFVKLQVLQNMISNKSIGYQEICSGEKERKRVLWH